MKFTGKKEHELVFFQMLYLVPLMIYYIKFTGGLWMIQSIELPSMILHKGLHPLISNTTAAGVCLATCIDPEGLGLHNVSSILLKQTRGHITFTSGI